MEAVPQPTIKKIATYFAASLFWIIGLTIALIKTFKLAVNFQIFGTLNYYDLIYDQLDPEWRQIQDLLQFIIIYCLVYQFCSSFFQKSTIFIIIAGLVLAARLTYLGTIFYLAIVILNFIFTSIIKKIFILPFIIWIVHVILLNIIFIYDGFEIAWKSSGQMAHEIDLSTSFPWKYIYIWGMFRMISYSIDYHYALLESNVPDQLSFKKHQGKCPLCFKQCFCLIGISQICIQQVAKCKQDNQNTTALLTICPIFFIHLYSIMGHQQHLMTGLVKCILDLKQHYKMWIKQKYLFSNSFPSIIRRMSFSAFFAFCLSCLLYGYAFSNHQRNVWFWQEKITPLEGAFILISSMLFLFFKLSLLWFFASLWACFDGIDVPQNVTKMIFFIYSARDLAKNFICTLRYNQFITFDRQFFLRYVYFCIGCYNWKYLNIICIYCLLAMIFDVNQFNIFLFLVLCIICIIEQSNFVQEYKCNTLGKKMVICLVKSISQIIIVSAILIGFASSEECIEAYGHKTSKNLGWLIPLMIAGSSISHFLIC